VSDDVEPGSDAVSDAPVAPALRIVSGSPTAEELAALTAVVSAVGGGDDEPAPRVRRGGWNDPAAQFRPPLTPGPNAWRASYR
jgi:hypothetical protein